MKEQYSTEELRERVELSWRIVTNLERIAEDKNDLDELLEQTSRIVTNLMKIEESQL